MALCGLLNLKWLLEVVMTSLGDCPKAFQNELMLVSLPQKLLFLPVNTIPCLQWIIWTVSTYLLHAGTLTGLQQLKHSRWCELSIFWETYSLVFISGLHTQSWQNTFLGTDNWSLQCNDDTRHMTSAQVYVTITTPFTELHETEGLRCLVTMLWCDTNLCMHSIGQYHNRRKMRNLA